MGVLSVSVHLIKGVIDDHDRTEWTVGYVDRDEDVERVLAQLRIEHRENRRILGPLRREERVYWKHYRDAQEQMSRELAIDRYDFDFLHKLSKPLQSAWCRRLNALLAKRDELAAGSLDKRPLPTDLDPVEYYAVVARPLAKPLDRSYGATQDERTMHRP